MSTKSKRENSFFQKQWTDFDLLYPPLFDYYYAKRNWSKVKEEMDNFIEYAPDKVVWYAI